MIQEAVTVCARSETVYLDVCLPVQHGVYCQCNNGWVSSGIDPQDPTKNTTGVTELHVVSPLTSWLDQTSQVPEQHCDRQLWHYMMLQLRLYNILKSCCQVGTVTQ